MAIIVINPYQYAAPIGPSADPYSDYVSLLLHGNGANNSTTFIDSSNNSHTVTANGDAEISTTQSKFGGSSMYFDGNGDYLSIPDSDQFEIGSGDFTFEAWIYLTGYSVAYQGQYYVAEIICKDSGSTGRGFTFYVLGTSTSWTNLRVALFSSNTNLLVTSATTSFNLNTWYHVAGVRNGTSLRLYKNGVDVGGGTNATTVQNTTTAVTVGSENPYFIAAGNAYYFPGYIDDLRITKGVARYTSNFNPPTVELPDPSDPDFSSVSLLLHGDGANGSTTFIDSSSYGHTVTPVGNAQISTTQSKFGGASMYFDGSGDNLTLTNDASFVFGTGDFTVEMWVYHTSENSQEFYYDGRPGSPAVQGAYVTLYKRSSNQLALFVNSANRIVSTTEILQDAWYHIAVCRQGSSTKLFLNGTQEGSTFTDTTNYLNGASRPIIGEVGGYIDDLRVTKGVARYTSNFTPPTAPLPHPVDPDFSNVSLLLHGNGANNSTAFIDSSSNSHTVTANGDAQISTAQSKFGGASMYFDGTGDYLSLADDTSLHLGSDNFTFEFWTYLDSTDGHFINKRVSTAANVQYLYLRLSGGSLLLWATSNGSNWDIAANFNFGNTAMSTGQWYHIALVRNGTEISTYVDGTKSPNTITSSAAIHNGGANPLRICGDVPYNGYLNGYIDDFRLTQGVARYTSNFTPPTAQLPGGETGTIVADGLVLHLDAGDSASYPGSGTTWTDLSGNGNNGTLVSMDGNNYSSANGGYLDFDGSSDYVDVGNLGINFGSLNIWIYLESTITSSTSAMSLLKYNDNIQAGITFGSCTSYATSETLTILQTDTNANQNFQRTYIRDNINSGWNYIVIQWNGSSYDFYINRQSKTTYDGTGTPSPAEQETITNLQVANTYTNGGTNFNGRISQVSIYNKALTQSEITQNYSALKGRYGL